MQYQSLLFALTLVTSAAAVGPIARRQSSSPPVITAEDFYITNFEIASYEENRGTTYFMNIRDNLNTDADTCSATRQISSGADRQCPSVPQMKLDETQCSTGSRYTWSFEGAAGSEPGQIDYLLHVKYAQQTGPVLEGCHRITRQELQCGRASDNSGAETYVGSPDFTIRLSENGGCSA